MQVAQRRSPPRLIAFYLPQYHPTPENDAWWGPGFTDWTNVAKARPLFPGHYQPHIPADLGFYDLRLPDVREAQAALAREYDIHGFCYYHYWFNGKQLLARPFQEVLQSGRPQLPFCLCWANENWTKRWDGLENQVLIRQDYSHADDLAHIRAMLPALTDGRYIRVRGKCLLLVYRTGLLPDPKRTAELWREIALREGGVELYLTRVERRMEGDSDSFDPAMIGFDAAVEFAPDPSATGPPIWRRYKGKVLCRMGMLSRAYMDHYIYAYNTLVNNMIRKPKSAYRRFACVTPSWDNSPRRKSGATIFRECDPGQYEFWLTRVLARTLEENTGDDALVFINAWNEWAEGSHLEPDVKHGRAYLESTRRAAWTALASIRDVRYAEPPAARAVAGNCP